MNNGCSPSSVAKRIGSQVGQRVLARPEQRVVAQQQVEQHDGERVPVGDDARHGLAPHDFRRHEVRRAQDVAALAVDADVVVVADLNVARSRIDEQVAETDVGVAQPARVQREKGVGQVAAARQTTSSGIWTWACISVDSDSNRASRAAIT